MPAPGVRTEMDSASITLIRWIAGGGLIAFGALCALGNFLILVSLPFRKEKEGGVSFIPIIGGVLLTLGLLIIPFSGSARWCWVGLLIDFGCVPLFAWASVDSLFRKKPNP